MNDDLRSISFFPEHCIHPKSGSEASNGFCLLSVGAGESWKEQGGHRLAYRLFIGPIPKKIRVMHSCSDKLCINPKHLYLESSAATGVKSAEKTRGEKNWQSALTDEIVKMIMDSKLGNAELGRMYGVSRHCIAQVRAGRSWKHVTMKPK